MKPNAGEQVALDSEGVWQVRVSDDGALNADCRVAKPYGYQVAEGILFASQENNEELLAEYMHGAGFSSEQRALFRQKKKLVTIDTPNGPVHGVVPNIPGVAVDSLGNYSDETPAAVGDGVPEPVLAPVVDKRYTLNSVFTDATVSDRLGFSEQSIQMAKRTACVDPRAAAAALTSLARVRFPNVQVTAGDYARSRTGASNTIAEWRKGLHREDPCISGKVVGDTLYLSYVEPEHYKTVDGPLWTVSGPLAVARSVRDIYQLAVFHGPNHIITLFSSETVILNIEVYDEVLQAYCSGTIQGCSSMDGILPVGAPLVASDLTSDQVASITSLASANVLPVFSSTGSVVGSSVRVTDRHVILNSHTYDNSIDREVNIEIDGVPVDQVRSVGYDMSVVVRSGGKVGWMLRHPKLGEKVVLCYRVSEHEVEYTKPLRILRVVGEEIIIADSELLRPGTSGAAVIAVSDYALLGIFSSSTRVSNTCAAFTGKTLMRITTEGSVSDVVTTGTAAGHGDLTYARFVKAGLASYLVAVSKSVQPLYGYEGTRRVHVGCAASYAGAWRTTVDPSVVQLFDGGSVPLQTAQETEDRYICEAPTLVSGEVPLCRAAHPGESVCVLARDDSGDVVLSVAVAVTHVYANATSFRLEDFGLVTETLAGGLVVALRDCAVLGQYHGVRVASDGDQYGWCVGMPQGCVDMVTSWHAVGDVSGAQARELLASALVDRAVIDADTADFSTLGAEVIRTARSRYARRSGSSSGDDSPVPWKPSAVAIGRFLDWLRVQLNVETCGAFAQTQYLWFVGCIYMYFDSVFPTVEELLFGVG